MSARHLTVITNPTPERRNHPSMLPPKDPPVRRNEPAALSFVTRPTHRRNDPPVAARGTHDRPGHTERHRPAHGRQRWGCGMTAKESHSYTLRLAAPESEFSQPFVQGMANRMAVSFHKYGFVADSDNDVRASIIQRLDKYAATGNTEWLMDVANFAMIEYLKPHHPDAHFAGTDSDQSPGRTRLDGTVDAERNVR